MPLFLALAFQHLTKEPFFDSSKEDFLQKPDQGFLF